ncbi:MAG: hypothetical protein Q8O76_00145 [Chloroflexota bacterium]|nr:hypothetical protein [Chloroflexota bacterium]
MSEANAIVFKAEHSLWLMLESGEKQWDARRWDLIDDRILRLAEGRWQRSNVGRVQPSWVPEEAEVTFLDKQTGETLTFRYQGMEFAEWAPGWVFLRLGGIISRVKRV